VTKHVFTVQQGLELDFTKEKKREEKKYLALQERVNEIDVEESYVWGLEE